jgi:membrane protease YdiL (CAAX protease family)
VPAEFWTDAARMATSGLLVAAGAVPVGLVARARRPRGEPPLPRWAPWPVPWTGFEVVVAFLMVTIVLPVAALQLLTSTGFYQHIYGADFLLPGAPDADPEQLKEANTLRMLWANLLALPAVIGLLWLAAKSLYPKWKPNLAGRGSTAGKVWLAVAAWLALAPVVLTFNAVVNAVAQWLDVPPETHALAKLAARPLLDQVLFALEACVGAPLREELIFRGVLLAWCVGRIRVPGAGPTPLTDARPAFVMVAVVARAVMEQRTGPIVFAALLVVGFALVWRFARVGARRARAVYATAAFFAMVHAGVWPNPVPLFVLGLGLGWLAVRTNGIVVPAVVHGLFNAVSVAFVLRG